MKLCFTISVFVYVNVGPAVLEKDWRSDFEGFISSEKRAVHDIVRNLQRQDSRSNGTTKRGVVIIGGRHHDHHRQGKLTTNTYYTLDALLSIAALRRTGCSLPVELWHDHDPTLLDAIEAPRILSRFAGSVRFRDLWEVAGGRSTYGFQLITLVPLMTDFDEFLFLDADNVVLQDPTHLFTSTAYRRTGIILWPDGVLFERTHLVCMVIDCSNAPMRMGETGQMVINRVRHLKKLELANALNLHWDRFAFRAPFFFNGAADMFTFAWLILSAPLHMVDSPPGMFGSIGRGGIFCGHSHAPSHPVRLGVPMFIHRTMAKLSYGNQTSFSHAIKQGGVNVRIGESSRGCRPCGHSYSSRWRRCIDLVSDDGSVDVDISPELKHVVFYVTALEEELMSLRSHVANTECSALRTRWWIPLARYFEGSRARASVTFISIIGDGADFQHNLGASRLYRERFESPHHWLLYNSSRGRTLSSFSQIARRDAESKYLSEYLLFIHPDLYLPDTFEKELMERLEHLNLMDPTWSAAGFFGVPHDYNPLNGQPRVVGRGRDHYGRYTMDASNFTVAQCLDESAIIVRSRHSDEPSPPFDSLLPSTKRIWLGGTDTVLEAMARGRKSYVIGVDVAHAIWDSHGRSDNAEEAIRESLVKFAGAKSSIMHATAMSYMSEKFLRSGRVSLERVWAQNCGFDNHSWQHDMANMEGPIPFDRRSFFATYTQLQAATTMQ